MAIAEKVGELSVTAPIPCTVMWTVIGADSFWSYYEFFSCNMSS